jgi:hypothetical protein
LGLIVFRVKGAKGERRENGEMEGHYR